MKPATKRESRDCELAEIERSSSDLRVTVDRYDTAKSERHSGAFGSPPLGSEI